MNKKTLDIASGLLGVGVAAAMYVTAAAFPASAVHASQYVKFLTLTTAALCAVLIVTAALSKRPTTTVQWIKARRPFAVTLTATLAYVAAMYWLGFYVASAIYMMVLGWALGHRKPLGLVLATAVLLLVIWGVFEKFLTVPIPQGFWEV